MVEQPDYKEAVLNKYENNPDISTFQYSVCKAIASYFCCCTIRPHSRFVQNVTNLEPEPAQLPRSGFI